MTNMALYQPCQQVPRCVLACAPSLARADRTCSPPSSSRPRLNPANDWPWGLAIKLCVSSANAAATAEAGLGGVVPCAEPWPADARVGARSAAGLAGAGWLPGTGRGTAGYMAAMCGDTMPAGGLLTVS